MRLHEFERRVLSTVGAALVLLTLPIVLWCMWAVVESDGLPAAQVASAFVLAAVVLASSWPVLHVAIAVARGAGSRPRRPDVWIAVYVVAVLVWSGVLLLPLLLAWVGLFYVGVPLLSLLAARRLVLAAVRRVRG